jgi:hypothetical protein
MKQEIYEDPYDFEDWSREQASRCYVHLVNAPLWSTVTGAPPPVRPPTAREYTDAGFPWFDWYEEDARALDSTPRLKTLKSVGELAKEKGEDPIPDNEALEIRDVRVLRRGLRRDQVREGNF